MNFRPDKKQRHARNELARYLKGELDEGEEKVSKAATERGKCSKTSKDEVKGKKKVCPGEGADPSKPPQRKAKERRKLEKVIYGKAMKNSDALPDGESFEALLGDASKSNTRLTGRRDGNNIESLGSGERDTVDEVFLN